MERNDFTAKLRTQAGPVPAVPPVLSVPPVADLVQAPECHAWTAGIGAPRVRWPLFDEAIMCETLSKC